MEETCVKVLFASSNAGKLREVRNAGTGFEIISVKEHAAAHGLPLIPDPEENADTYEGNARIKVEAYFRWAGLATLGDDSGIEVEALDGRPGVFANRYGGEPGNAAKNMAKLLGELKDKDNRRARFVSYLLLRLPDGREYSAFGTLEGEILKEPRGRGGFGYDPLFFLPEHGKTVAELHDEHRCFTTHRVAALQKLWSELVSK